MDQAKSSVKKFLSKDGKHDTSIHESISPAVQHETVQQQQHERATTAIDREVHQDHYHTSEQPIHHQETLATQHHHNMMPVEHRSHEHGNEEDVKRRLAEEQSRYKDQTQRVEGERTREDAGIVGGEHVHHHVHENIQPVIQKQTVEPHVVHTTVPVHEVHHNAAQHHSASALPAVSMEDFKKQGGSLTGREERHDHFPGEPRGFGGHLRDEASSGSQGVTGSSGLGSSGRGAEMDGRGADTKTSGINPSDIGRGGGVSSGRDTGLGSDAYGSSGRGEGLGSSTGASGLGRGAQDEYSSNTGTSGLGREARDQYSNTTGSGRDGLSNTASQGRDGLSNTASQTGGKPSLMDKLNPKVDSTGDGQAGFMK